MKKQKQKKGYEANYGNTTPEDVARALLKFRPKTEQDKRGRRDSNPQRTLR